MLFNSAVFVVFFAIFYALYLALRRRVRAQNLLLVVGGMVFYGWWDWRFLFLLALSTAIDFIVAQRLEDHESPVVRKRWLMVSVIGQLSLLAFFKYFNFFADSAVALLNLLGLHASEVTLRVILPVGISFYTFQTLGYTIDVYRRRQAACRDLLLFATYVGFFPQLVAGPIERAAHMLPQMAAPRRIRLEDLQVGLYLILWGYFKKLFMADNLAPLVNQVFDTPAGHGTFDALAALLAFSFQIYGDFSGYTDIARGLGRLLGFQLALNFRVPYAACSPSEFWQRWHISLSGWLRDYLYISLGGNRGGERRTLRNLMITMVLGGLWHGAAWNYVVWGFFHGLILILYRLAERAREQAGRAMPRGFGAWLVMSLLTVVGWFFFRVTGTEQAVGMARALLNVGGDPTGSLIYRVIFFSWPIVALDFYCERKGDLLAPLRWKPAYLALLVAAMSWMLVVFGAREVVQFVYFQF